MSKVKTAFFCSSCGYESTKWTGKCPSCNSWNSFVQEVIQKAVLAGALEISPATDYDYGYRQGMIKDPFGHYWQIQKKI